MVVLKDNVIEYKYAKRFENVTNNQMELRALIFALKWIQARSTHETYTI